MKLAYFDIRCNEFYSNKEKFLYCTREFYFKAEYLLLVQKKMHMNGMLYCVNVYLHVHIHVPVFPKYG